MRQIARLIERKGWTQAEAAERCGVTQPRINDLLRGRIARFSLDALVNIAAALGRKVAVKLDDAARLRFVLSQVSEARPGTTIFLLNEAASDLGNPPA